MPTLAFKALAAGDHTTTDGQSFTCASFTPSAGDGLVIGCIYMGSTATPTITDSQSLGWTLIDKALFNSSGSAIAVFTSNTAAAASSMTITCDLGSGQTGTVFYIYIYKVQSATRFGSSAVRQSAKQENGNGSSNPSEAFAANALTSNAIIDFLAINTNSGIAQPTGWTLDNETVETTPSTTGHVDSVTSGFTGTTPPWADHTGVGTNFAVITVELDFSAATSAAAVVPQARPLVLRLAKYKRRFVWPVFLNLPVAYDVLGNIYTPTGSLFANGLLSGDGIQEFGESGSLLASGFLSGADVAEHSETGSLVPDTLLSGADAAEHAETGALTPFGFLSGADVAEHAETGTLMATGALSGTSSKTLGGKTGSLLAGALASGADASEHSETGTLMATGLLAGVSQKIGAGKTGSLTAGGLVSGGDASTHAETGALVAAAFLAGGDATTYTETGSLRVGALLAGVSAYVPSGTATVLPGLHSRQRGRTAVSTRGTVGEQEHGSVSTSLRGRLTSALRGRMGLR